jgi:2-polyprenyl-3-methyl-5-hydroxy-6-metoxy-1,4-benzoquinol methylase
MACCCQPGGSCSDTGSFFSRWSRFYAKRFRSGGLEPVQKHLLEGIRKRPVQGSSVLDIGCGVGALHLTLLKAGAGRSVGIDMSEGMLREAKHFAGISGVADRTHYLLGDFVQLSPTIAVSDITILDKVVCCYEDVESLVTTAAAKTKHTLALSHPKENVLMRSLFKGHRVLAKLFRWSFHPFWHDWENVAARVLSHGFELTYTNATISWQVLVFTRK